VASPIQTSPEADFQTTKTLNRKSEK